MNGPFQDGEKTVFVEGCPDRQMGQVASQGVFAHENAQRKVYKWAAVYYNEPSNNTVTVAIFLVFYPISSGDFLSVMMHTLKIEDMAELGQASE